MFIVRLNAAVEEGKVIGVHKLSNIISFKTNVVFKYINIWYFFAWLSLVSLGIFAAKICLISNKKLFVEFY
jgi:hypothetical protein